MQHGRDDMRYSITVRHMHLIVSSIGLDQLTGLYGYLVPLYRSGHVISNGEYINIAIQKADIGGVGQLSPSPAFEYEMLGISVTVAVDRPADPPPPTPLYSKIFSRYSYILGRIATQACSYHWRCVAFSLRRGLLHESRAVASVVLTGQCRSELTASLYLRAVVVVVPGSMRPT